MKSNIKPDTKNRIEGHTNRHTLPTRLCFNFFSQRIKILKFNDNRIFGTFVFAAVTKTINMAKAKEPNIANTSMSLKIYL